MRNAVCEFAAKPALPVPGRVWSILMRGLLLFAWSGEASGQDAIPLRVRLEVGPGPFYTGQGIELAVAVTARDQRPAIELPRPNGADLWTCGTSFQPISATGIGQVTSGENVYITRLRLVPRRPGSLEVPAVIGPAGRPVGQEPFGAAGDRARTPRGTAGGVPGRRGRPRSRGERDAGLGARWPGSPLPDPDHGPGRLGQYAPGLT